MLLLLGYWYYIIYRLLYVVLLGCLLLLEIYFNNYLYFILGCFGYNVCCMVFKGCMSVFVVKVIQRCRGALQMLSSYTCNVKTM